MAFSNPIGHLYEGAFYSPREDVPLGVLKLALAYGYSTRSLRFCMTRWLANDYNGEVQILSPVDIELWSR